MASELWLPGWAFAGPRLRIETSWGKDKRDKPRSHYIWKVNKCILSWMEEICVKGPMSWKNIFSYNWRRYIDVETWGNDSRQIFLKYTSFSFTSNISPWFVFLTSQKPTHSNLSIQLRSDQPPNFCWSYTECYRTDCFSNEAQSRTACQKRDHLHKSALKAQ